LREGSVTAAGSHRRAELEEHADTPRGAVEGREKVEGVAVKSCPAAWPQQL